MKAWGSRRFDYRSGHTSMNRGCICKGVQTTRRVGDLTAKRALRFGCFMAVWSSRHINEFAPLTISSHVPARLKEGSPGDIACSRCSGAMSMSLVVSAGFDKSKLKQHSRSVYKSSPVEAVCDAIDGESETGGGERLSTSIC